MTRVFEVAHHYNNISLPAQSGAIPGATPNYFTAQHLFPGLYARRVGANVIRVVGESAFYFGLDNSSQKVVANSGTTNFAYSVFEPQQGFGGNPDVAGNSAGLESSYENLDGQVSYVYVPANTVEYFSYRKYAKPILRSAGTSAVIVHLAYGRLMD